MAEVKIGIIGCGGISRSHIMGYKEHPDCRIVAVADINEERAKERAQLAGTEKYYLNFHELLDKERPDGVSICTPPITHAKIATQCLSRCVSVLCEKPFSTSPEEARSMVTAGKNSGAVLQVAYKRRLYPDAREAKAMIGPGKIGKVLFFRNMFGGFHNMKGSWFADPEAAGGGAFIDAGSHALDLLRYFCGEAKRVSFVKANLIQDLEVEDAATLLVELESGAMATLAITWSLPVPSTHYAEIYGSEGTILVGGGDSRYMLGSEKEWKRIEGPPAQVGAQMGHFVECIQGKATSIATGTDGLRVQEIIRAAYESHRSGRWEDVQRALS